MDTNNKKEVRVQKKQKDRSHDDEFYHRHMLVNFKKKKAVNVMQKAAAMQKNKIKNQTKQQIKASVTM